MPKRTMTVRPLQSAALLALLFAPALLHAQAEVSSSEELRLEALAREQAEIYVPRNSVSVGFRVLKSGAKVQFGHLGSVPFASTPAPLADGAVQRVYDNGQVNPDAPRSEESADTTTTLPDGRYQTSVNSPTVGPDGVLGTDDDETVNIVTGNFLSFIPGSSRIWGYGSPAQAAVRPGFIAMSSYSTVSDGAVVDQKQGPVGGIELQFARTLGKATGRTQWSLVTGISLNDINNKIEHDSSATLRTNTDFYSLNGLPAPETSVEAPYTAPSNPTGILETTTPIGDTPVDHTETTLVGGTTVHGQYQIKGAYFLLRVGPAVRTQLTERLGLSASLGLAGAYAGTHYTAVESFVMPDIGARISTANPEQSDANKFLSGYYADLNLEWAATESTGLFGGITAQKFGDYDQTVLGRTARIDIGSSVGFRGGISIKF